MFTIATSIDLHNQCTAAGKGDGAPGGVGGDFDLFGFGIGAWSLHGHLVLAGFDVELLGGGGVFGGRRW